MITSPSCRCRPRGSSSSSIAIAHDGPSLLSATTAAVALLIANIESGGGTRIGLPPPSAAIYAHRRPRLHRPRYNNNYRQRPTMDTSIRPLSVIVAPSSSSSSPPANADRGKIGGMALSGDDGPSRPEEEEGGGGTTTTAPRDVDDIDDDGVLLRRRKQDLRRHVRSVMKMTYPQIAADPDHDENYVGPSPPSSSSSLLLSQRSDQVFERLFSLPQYESAKSIGIFLSMPYGEIRTNNAVRHMMNCGSSSSTSSTSSSSSSVGGRGGRGKVLYVPRVGLDFGRSEMDMVKCDVGPTTNTTTAESTEKMTMFYDGWPRNRWGIPEPPHASCATPDDVAMPGDIDLLVVPGLAFDINGHRLGQGKGYYDRFIARMRRDALGRPNCAGGLELGKTPLLVGVCLEEQFLHEVPHGVDLGHRGRGEIIPVTDHDYPMDIVLTPTRTLILRNVPSPSR
ncbi:hypothetical protein ACHAXA_000393 [Cyclostephanos tholiformis]|uniref:5-formyltetrahydrofolate cyclo-ligase n=1 Tax=Cyclostephanos tholiformis TaxID=382380 RepID=A0ABD3R3S2_9STRA